MTRFLASGATHSVPGAAAGARAGQSPAPFDGDLQRLAEILGALHYLRDGLRRQ